MCSVIAGSRMFNAKEIVKTGFKLCCTCTSFWTHAYGPKGHTQIDMHNEFVHEPEKCKAHKRKVVHFENDNTASKRIRGASDTRLPQCESKIEHEAAQKQEEICGTWYSIAEFKKYFPTLPVPPAADQTDLYHKRNRRWMTGVICQPAMGEFIGGVKLTNEHVTRSTVVKRTSGDMSSAKDCDEMFQAAAKQICLNREAMTTVGAANVDDPTTYIVEQRTANGFAMQRRRPLQQDQDEDEAYLDNMLGKSTVRRTAPSKPPSQTAAAAVDTVADDGATVDGDATDAEKQVAANRRAGGINRKRGGLKRAESDQSLPASQGQGPSAATVQQALVQKRAVEKTLREVDDWASTLADSRMHGTIKLAQVKQTYVALEKLLGADRVRKLTDGDSSAGTDQAWAVPLVQQLRNRLAFMDWFKQYIEVRDAKADVGGTPDALRSIIEKSTAGDIADQRVMLSIYCKLEVPKRAMTLAIEDKTSFPTNLISLLDSNCNTPCGMRWVTIRPRACLPSVKLNRPRST